MIIIAHYGAIHLLKRRKHPLHDDSGRKLGGVVDGLFQFLLIMSRRDAHGRARIGRLHDYRIGQFLLYLLNDSLTALVPFLIGKPYEIHYGDAAVAKYLLHRNLIHSVSGSEGVTAHVRYAYHLEYSLQGSIFAVSSVKCRENGIYLSHNLLRMEKPGVRIQIPVAVDGFEIHLGTVFQE